MTTHESLVKRDGYTLTILSLDSGWVVGDFIRELRVARFDCCYDDLILDFNNIEKVFPNACTPMAGIIELYRNKYNTNFTYQNVSDFLRHTSMLSPLSFSSDSGHDADYPMNKVWSFSGPRQIHSLVDACLERVEQAAECQKGVIPGLEWCLNEVMDNVLQHSDCDHGFIMGQIHKKSGHIAICIYDYGQGIYNSLRHSSHAPTNALDAIIKSLQEEVTRDKSIGQGNGLWGLYKIVSNNSGLLNITSGSGYVGYDTHNSNMKKSSHVYFPDKDHSSTNVDFQIDFGKGISIARSLGGHEPTNMRIENLEDSSNNIVYKLAENETGTGTRQSGVGMRNKVLNIMNESDSLIILDFNGVNVVSSSFADEFVGKLMVRCGAIVFNQRFRIVGMNPTVQVITERSVNQRLSEAYSRKQEEA